MIMRIRFGREQGDWTRKRFFAEGESVGVWVTYAHYAQGVVFLTADPLQKASLPITQLRISVPK